MFATLTSVAETEQQPGCLGRVVAQSPIMNRPLMLSLWATADQDGEVYAVTDLHTGVAIGQPPAVLQLLFFDGPRGAAQVAADERANRERIIPAVIDVPGWVVGMVLRGADGACVIIGLATDREAFEEIARRTMATDLLPGEDPALLAGPVRFEQGHVESADLVILQSMGVTA